MKIISLLILGLITILVVNGCGESNTTEKLTTEQPTSEIIRINYSDFDLLVNNIIKKIFEYNPEIIGGDLKSWENPMLSRENMI